MGKVYPEEVKNKAVELYRLDEKTTYAEVGRDLGISAETIRNWCRGADRDEGRLNDGQPTSDERAELAPLRLDKAAQSSCSMGRISVSICYWSSSG